MNSPLLTLQPKYYVVKKLRVVCDSVRRVRMLALVQYR